MLDLSRVMSDVDRVEQERGGKIIQVFAKHGIELNSTRIMGTNIMTDGDISYRHLGLPGRGLKTSLNCFGVSSSSPLPTLHRDRVETTYKGDGREVTCVSPMCQALANILEKFSAKKGNVISIIGTPSQPSLHVLKLRLFCWLRASRPPPAAMPSRLQVTRRDRSERWSPTRRFLRHS